MRVSQQLLRRILRSKALQFRIKHDPKLSYLAGYIDAYKKSKKLLDKQGDKK